MPIDSATIDEILAPLRSMRGRPRQSGLAECARLIATTCQQPHEPRNAVTEIVQQYDRWPGVATFSQTLARHIGAATEPDSHPAPSLQEFQQAIRTAWREVASLPRPDEHSLESATWRRIRAMEIEDRDSLIEAALLIHRTLEPYQQNQPATRPRALMAIMIAAANAAWSTHGQELQTWQTPDYIRRPPPIQCQACRDTGTIEDGAGIPKWCTCALARTMQADNPAWLDLISRTRANTLEHSARKAAPPAAAKPAPAAGPRRIIDQTLCRRCNAPMIAYSDGHIEPCKCSRPATPAAPMFR